jgi:DNA-binding CsgD family transcriptional regulator
MDAAELIAFAADASACVDHDTFRRYALELLGAVAPFDKGTFLPPESCGPLLGIPDAAHRSDKAFQRHAELLPPGKPTRRDVRDTTATGGGYLTAFFIVRPQGIRRQIAARLSFRDELLGGIHLCRHDRSPAFADGELDKVRMLVPAIAIALAALRTSVPASQPSQSVSNESGLRSRLDALSVRERQVVDMVMHGFRNGEISEALGTSPNTVRNQLSRIFDKLGASSRTELAVWAQSVANS